MKNFIVTNVDDSRDYFITDNLNELIEFIYEVDLADGKSFETVKEYFFNNYVVFESNTEIKEVTN